MLLLLKLVKEIVVVGELVSKIVQLAFGCKEHPVHYLVLKFVDRVTSAERAWGIFRLWLCRVFKLLPRSNRLYQARVNSVTQIIEQDGRSQVVLQVRLICIAPLLTQKV